MQQNELRARGIYMSELDARPRGCCQFRQFTIR